MAKKTPYHVHAYPGELLGKFPSEASAMRVAQIWSKVWAGWAEVIFEDKKAGGIIAQFDKGELTREFAANHDWLKPWLGRCKERLA